MIEVCVMGELLPWEEMGFFYEKYFDANLFNYLPSQNFLFLSTIAQSNFKLSHNLLIFICK